MGISKEGYHPTNSSGSPRDIIAGFVNNIPFMKRQGILDKELAQLCKAFPLMRKVSETYCKGLF